jgi:hypothetical protein
LFFFLLVWQELKNMLINLLFVKKGMLESAFIIEKNPLFVKQLINPNFRGFPQRWQLGLITFLWWVLIGATRGCLFLCQVSQREVWAKQADGALIVANRQSFRLLRPYAP